MEKAQDMRMACGLYSSLPTLVGTSFSPPGCHSELEDTTEIPSPLSSLLYHNANNICFLEFLVHSLTQMQNTEKNV